MLIAQLTESGIVVNYYKELFPNTSFSSNGPDADWFVENNCKKVNLFKTHDRATQKLVPCEPYEEGDWVYTVEVQDLSEEELAALAPPVTEEAVTEEVVTEETAPSEEPA